MAQPEYVPAGPTTRVSERLPTPLAWKADRPGEVVHQGGQPTGDRFGTAGPDQGYALKLARRWEDKVVLASGEQRADVMTGCVAVALKRATAFSRAPVIFDIEAALALFGYLTNAGTELVAFRKPLFEGCVHSYNQVRDIADRVPEHTLRLTPADVKLRLAAGGWKAMLGLD
jgi:hypothetical protein